MDNKQFAREIKETVTEVMENHAERIKALEKDNKEAYIASQRPGGSMRTTTSDTEASKAFGEYVRYGRTEMSDTYRKALVQDDVGQVLVPEDLDSQIYQSLPDVSVMRALATVRPTSRDRVRRRSLGKPSVGWGKLETGQQTLEDSAPTPTEDYLFVEDLYGLARIGEDELADVEVDLGTLMSQNFGDVIAEEEDRAFFTGGGHEVYQPEGVLMGDTIERVPASQAGGVDLPDFLELIYAVPGPHRRSGAFVVNSDTERRIRQIRDDNGQFLWQPSVQAGVPNTFFGYPIHTQDDIPVVPESGTSADVAVFGDFRHGYQVRDRQRNSVQRLNELYAEEGLVGFKVRHRVGGAVVWPEALRVLEVPAS